MIKTIIGIFTNVKFLVVLAVLVAGLVFLLLPEIRRKSRLKYKKMARRARVSRKSAPPEEELESEAPGRLNIPSAHYDMLKKEGRIQTPKGRKD
ncbi:MAG: hypothetical protein JW874_15995 [Spirochaetales bacterium]|nr:hypothetical protein [Spirochaetales bacterium]